MKTTCTTAEAIKSARQAAESLNMTPCAFTEVQKIADDAAEDVAAQLDIERDDAARLLAAIAGTRIYEVTTGRAETLRTHARRAADRVAAYLHREPADAAKILFSVLSFLYLDNETDPNRVPDWTRFAYEINTMKRKKCTFGQAHKEAEAIRSRIERNQPAPIATPALYVLSFTTCPDVADTPANADKFTTHYSNDRRALFALLINLQTSGTPLYHATIKSA